MKKALVLLICFMFTGCVSVSEGTETTKAVTDVYIPIMGTMEYFEADDSFIKGAKMAIEDANSENNGYTFTSHVYDDENNYEKGMAVFDGLIHNKNTVAVIGTQNFAILNSAAESAKKAQRILIMPHGSEESARENDNNFVFANTFSAEDIGEGMGIYLASNGVEKIAICYNDADLSHNIVSSLADNKNIQIVDYVCGDITEDNFDEIYKRWEILDVRGVAIIHNTDVAFEIAKMIRNKNINMTIVGDYAFDIPDEIASMGSLAEGIAMSFIFPVEPSAKLDNFKMKYSEKYSEQATLWAAHGYDSVKMITDTMKQYKTANPNEIASTLHENGYEGITHNIKFDKKGSMIGNEPFFQKVENGKFEVVGEKYE